MSRKTLKLAIVASELTHQSLAIKANAYLPQDLHLSEHDITRIVTYRKDPTPEQATALARVLGWLVVEIFPEEGPHHA